MEQSAIDPSVIVGAEISIVYVTGRHRPMLDWTLDDLEAQAQSDDRIELIVVDALGRSASELTIRPCLDERFTLQVVAPKPTPWQGAARVTSCDWWALSSSRNTGLVYASADHIVFMDDRCHLGDRFLSVIRDNARGGSPRVLAGTYTKDADGITTVDHRIQRHPNGLANCGGGWVFGCIISMPTEWALEVNGWEEGCDGLSMEDCIFGLNLEHRGYPIDFHAELLVRQERSAAACQPSYRRTDKGVSPLDKSHEALDRFGRRSRTEFTPDLRALRASRSWPLPNADATDWYDGELIRDMR